MGVLQSSGETELRPAPNVIVIGKPRLLGSLPETMQAAAVGAGLGVIALLLLQLFGR